MELMEIIGIVVGIAVVVSIGYAVYKVRAVSKTLFGTSDIKKIAGQFEQQEREYAETPKSVCAMTNLELPRIQKDFPEFHWPEWRQRCENQLRAYLYALSSGSLSGLSEMSAVLKEQIRLRIEGLKAQEHRAAYEGIRIHRTEITKYEKTAGMCRIRVQSALEYLYSLHTPEEKKNIEARKEQHRFNLELVYVQDLTKLGEDAASFGTNCPNCGAPIRNLGSKYCEYCGTGVEPVNVRAWVLHRIEEG